MRLQDFDYNLPPELIAQEPAADRDGSRLLVLTRHTGQIAHRRFSDLPAYLHPGDLLILNDTKVIPARLSGAFEDGRPVEVLLVRPVGESQWTALVRPAKHARVGRRLILACGHLEVAVAGGGAHGQRVLALPPAVDLRAILERYGATPLPPYIKRRVEDQYPGDGTRLSAARASGVKALDSERYQTVYARVEGAVAAPTAGLHFTLPLLERLREQGVLVCPLTLHVGPGTFQPVKVEEIARHRMEPEPYTLPEETARALREARAAGRRVVAVGTTSVRTLEHVARLDERIPAGSGFADLFITPGHGFRLVGALLTNFHLPRSTLLMLVSAFAGLEHIRKAYAEAIALRYRFYSYGDAMLIL